jgi:L-asparaginase
VSRHVTIVATGGTISSSGERGRARPTERAERLLDEIEPLPADIVVTEVVDAAHVISPALSLADMWSIVDRAEAAARTEGVSGVVVTHGTATLIDTAFLAYLRWALPVGLAFTGAMAAASRVSRDGPQNLRDALLAAADPALKNAGPTVVANNLIHSPRFVQKTHKRSFAAFSSGSYGTFGYVDDDLVRITATLGAPPRLAGGPPDDDAVQVIKAVPGMNAVLLDAALEAGARGIVLECLPGRGGVPPRLQDALNAAIERGCPVVLAGEAEGRIQGNYRGPAHAAHYLERGAISGSDLPPSRCRTLVAYLLAGGQSTDAIRDVFATVAP